MRLTNDNLPFSESCETIEIATSGYTTSGKVVQNCFKMYKKKTSLPLRPEPPTIEKIIEDVEGCHEDDVVFASMLNDGKRKYLYYRSPVKSDSSIS